jgi:hypothetical protein
MGEPLHDMKGRPLAAGLCSGEAGMDRLLVLAALFGVLGLEQGEVVF